MEDSRSADRLQARSWRCVAAFDVAHLGGLSLRRFDSVRIVSLFEPVRCSVFALLYVAHSTIASARSSRFQAPNSVYHIAGSSV